MIQCLLLSQHQTNKTFKRLKKKMCHGVNQEVIKLFHCFNAGSSFFSLNAKGGDDRRFVLICDSRITGGRGKD